MLRSGRFSIGILFSAIALLGAREASAEPVRWHLELSLAHAVGQPQQSEYGWGGIGRLGLEVPVATPIGIEATVGGIYLANGDPPKQVGVAEHGAGSALAAFLGARLRPFAAKGPGGFFIDAHGGYILTGDLSRPGFDAHLGYDIRTMKEGRLDIGPVAGYTQIFQVGNQLRPNDAHIVSLGVQISLGAAKPERPDTDKDSVFDDEDACPAVAGERSSDPSLNGCPRPVRGDQDNDTIFDDEDACPTVAGIRTTDPKTNGCPRADRDSDGVFDDEDACPDVPGPRTEDPKTNGCPKPVEAIHVEEDKIEYNDRIHFKPDIAVVTWESWRVIEKLAHFITATPEITQIEVVGHTDETGPEEYNVRLSKLRAEAVKTLLVRYGVPEDRLTTVGLGWTRPRAVGHSERQYRENRRVEFFITRVRNANGGETSVGNVPMGEGERK